MKCPTCVSEGNTSKVYPGGSRKTLMGWSSYYDEQGVYHHHDPNISTTSYKCSQGHEWLAKSLTRCLNCNYGSTVI